MFVGIFPLIFMLGAMNRISRLVVPQLESRFLDHSESGRRRCEWPADYAQSIAACDHRSVGPQLDECLFRLLNERPAVLSKRPHTSDSCDQQPTVPSPERETRDQSFDSCQQISLHPSLHLYEGG